MASACSPVGAPALLVWPDPERDGQEGREGPYGAAVVTLTLQARVTEILPTSVVYPADAEQNPAVETAPVVVLLHGGFVAPERYFWLASHLATRGYVSVLPEAELLLAITQPGNGPIALQGLRDEAARPGPLFGLVVADGPAAVMGHSLGGVMAARHWVQDDQLDLLVELASYPTSTDPVEAQIGRPVLSIVGSTDNAVQDAVDGFARFPGPGGLYVIDGMNHFAWTDDATSRELGRDGALTRPIDEVRLDALRIVDAYLDVYLTAADSAALDGPFAGTVAP